MTEPAQAMNTYTVKNQCNGLTFRSTGSHNERGVVLAELLHADFTDFISYFGQH